MSIQLHKIIYNIGERLRNPSLQGIFNELKASDFASREELERLQLNKLKALVTHAYKHSTFYKKLLDDLHMTPDSIKTLEDLKRLPILTKKDLVDHNKSMHTTDSFKFKKLYNVLTSGSTGVPLTFKRDEYADSFNRASIKRGYSWYGVQVWERNLYFWGYDFDKMRALKVRFQDFLLNRFRLFNYKERDIESLIHKLKKVSYISGYSSIIYRLAKLINAKDLNLTFNRLKMVKGTSEKIYDSYINEVQKAFGKKMICEYGSVESGIIAFECPHGKIHINMEGVIVEEDQGEIIMTNLAMKSFPIIRYRLGDYIVLADADEVCSCGRQHRILHEITGRIGREVYGVSQVYPSMSFLHLFKNLNKEHQLTLTYQVIQPEKGKLIFNVEETLTAEQYNLLEQEIIKYFKDDMSFEIHHTESLNKNARGKLKSYISYV